MKISTWPKLKPIQAFTPVLITCKFDKDPASGDSEKLETSFSPLYVYREKKSALKGEKIQSEYSDPTQFRTHSSFQACPRYLQVWQRSNQRWLKKAGDIIFHRSKARNAKMTGKIRPAFELVRDFMPVLISSKFDDDWIHSNWEQVGTPFSPFKVNGNTQGQILCSEESDLIQIRTLPRFYACPCYLQVWWRSVSRWLRKRG